MQRSALTQSGRTTQGVVRVGDTIRRPMGPNAPFVHSLLQHLAWRDFHAAPRFLGVDELGREILSYLDGEVPSDLGDFSTPVVRTAARLLRDFHDATADSGLCDPGEVVCHGDPSPCNAVFRRGVPYAWIDFDAARPGLRRHDVGYAAWLWLDIGNADWPPSRQGTRLRDFVLHYGELPIRDAVTSILDAQIELSARPGAPRGVQAWAAECHRWTTSHQGSLEEAVAGS